MQEKSMRQNLFLMSLAKFLSGLDVYKRQAVNRSASVEISSRPPCNSVKLFAMARPSPLPSVRCV